MSSAPDETGARRPWFHGKRFRVYQDSRILAACATVEQAPAPGRRLFLFRTDDGKTVATTEPVTLCEIT